MCVTCELQSAMSTAKINIKNIDYFKYRRLVIDGNRDDYALCSRQVQSLCDAVQTLTFRDDEFDDASDQARFDDVSTCYRQILASKRIDPVDMRLKSGWWGEAGRAGSAYSAGTELNTRFLSHRSNDGPRCIYTVQRSIHVLTHSLAWAPAGILARGAKSTTSFSSPSVPCFSILLLPHLPFPPALSTSPFLLCCGANPFNTVGSGGAL